MKLLTIKQVKNKTTLDETAIESLSRQGLFPYAVALPEGGRAWLAHEVAAWVLAVTAGVVPELLELLCQEMLEDRPACRPPRWRLAA